MCWPKKLSKAALNHRFLGTGGSEDGILTPKLRVREKGREILLTFHKNPFYIYQPDKFLHLCHTMILCNLDLTSISSDASNSIGKETIATNIKTLSGSIGHKPVHTKL